MRENVMMAGRFLSNTISTLPSTIQRLTLVAPIDYELSLTVGRISTRSGNMYRTKDGMSLDA